ncbi:MAG: flagellar biosynthetic protein FliO [Phycisphaerae bacterium]|nr:flagellar biosynthetic protein FliO [Phycisphaerae bacterium]
MAIGRLLFLGVAFAATSLPWGVPALGQPATPVVVAAGPAATQPQSNTNDIEHRPIGGAAKDGSRSDGGAISNWVGPSWWALAIVLGLIFGAAWVLKRIGPNAVRNRQGGLFRSLSRWHLASRQYVTLVQVGRRVLLLGVTNQQINLLAEITDPAEIEHLLASCPAGRSAVAEGFSQLFGRHRDEMAEAAGETPSDSAGQAVSELGEAIGKIKSRISRGEK